MQRTYFWIFALMLVSNIGWAYGGGSSSKACNKPKFSNFTPAENVAAEAGSNFSFLASKNTYPNSIKVALKDQAIELTITSKNEAGYLVSGQIPATLKGAFARVAISAEGHNNCKGSDGWLLKIAP
jgi:hypothetical protein